MTPDDIELSFIREFSMAGNLISKTTSKAERRERVRQAIYVNCRMGELLAGSNMTYVEAFRLCYGERLNRRAAIRALPDHDEAQDDNDLGT